MTAETQPTSINMDNIIFEHRCKICRMATTHPNLFTELHEMVLLKGMGRSRPMNIINNKIQTGNLQIAVLNTVNMTFHFNKHVQLDHQMAMAVKSAEELAQGITIVPRRPSLATVAPQAAGALEHMMEQKVGSELQDYANLNDLIETIREKLALIGQHIEVDNQGIAPDGQPMIGPDGKPVIRKGVSLEAIQIFAKLTTEVRNCVVDLNKIRRSGSIMLLAMRSLAEKFCATTTRQLVPELEAISTMCRKYNIPESEIMRTMEGVKLRTVEILIDNAKMAVEEVMTQYRIKE